METPQGTVSSLGVGTITYISVYVLRDESDFGGLIGYIGIDYSWDGKMYKPKTLVFNPTIPPSPL
ncbi:hypothetical protein [Candidatus Clostridium radicumherbarum]|uniref:Uncharacterized protein n=1 Tax=Candidatus Clostridium radicumherbarum TaxID=3381662 RepID=A0ABW8TTG6_9CLOT